MFSTIIDKLFVAARMRSLPKGVHRTITEVKRRRLTYLSDRKLIALAELCLANEKRQIPGAIIEAGCALGGSAIVMTASKRRERKLTIYDVFAMIPPPTEMDGDDVKQRYEVIKRGESKGLDGDPYYGYQEMLDAKVISHFAGMAFPIEENTVSLIKGLIQDTLQVEEPVCLAHVDVDWYDPVKTCLERIWPALVVEGAIVFDDYSYYSGCRKAVDEYVRDLSPSSYRTDGSSGSFIVTKRG